MSHVLGIDLGTSYFKLAVFNRSGQLSGLSRQAVPRQETQGRSELSPERFRGALRTGLEEACGQAGITAGDIEALSYSSQANSFLLLDAQQQPLTPIILWPDLRAAQVSARVLRLWQRKDFLQTTGLGLSSPEFMVAKLAWFAENAPVLWSQTRHIMTISDYLVFCLTGAAAGDEGTASLLGLWDLRAHGWWGEALEAVQVLPEQLSTPLAPGTVAGAAAGAFAAELGLPPEAPVVAGSLDHHMAALGAGLGTVAENTDSTGTVLALLRTCEEWQPRPGCCMGPNPQRAGYYQMSFSNNGATALERYQQRHAPEHSLEELLAMAAEAPAGADGLRAAPHEDASLSLGSFSNRHTGMGHGHYVRALLESAAVTVDRLGKTLHDGGSMGRVVATGGGARSDLWLQIKADYTGAEFVVTECSEPACMGAALFAAVAAGWHPNFRSASQSWIVERRTFEPRPQVQAQYAHWPGRRGEVTVH